MTQESTASSSPKAKRVRRPAPAAPKAAAPADHLNDPHIIPSENLRVQNEHLLQGYDNDIELLSIEISARQRRLEDLERCRNGVLALLATVNPESEKLRVPPAGGVDISDTLRAAISPPNGLDTPS